MYPVGQIVAAMEGNPIQGGILDYPAVIGAGKMWYHVLLDIASLGMPYPVISIEPGKIDP